MESRLKNKLKVELKETYKQTLVTKDRQVPSCDCLDNNKASVIKQTIVHSFIQDFIALTINGY